MLDRQAGRSADAEAPLREALRILEASSDPLPRTRALMVLSSVESDRGNFVEAERLLLEVVAIREQRVGDSSELAATLNNLGNLYSEMKRYPDAVRVHERGLAMKEKVLGKRHFFVAQSLNNLANAYLALDQFEKAAEYHRRALELKQAVLEVGHPEIAVSEHNLGDVAYKAGDLAEGRGAVPARARALGEAARPRARVPRLQRRRARQRLPRHGPAREGRGPLPERDPADREGLRTGNAAVKEVQAEYDKLKASAR